MLYMNEMYINVQNERKYRYFYIEWSALYSWCPDLGGYMYKWYYRRPKATVP